MSKNQPSLKACGWFGLWNFFVCLNSKRSLFASSLVLLCLADIFPFLDGGRGRIRTCDPALIKRML